MQAIESLLLGLYDEDGRLNHVGRARVPSDGAETARLLEPLIGGEGFTGRAPGGKSRWPGKKRKPAPLKAVLVAEVSADHWRVHAPWPATRWRTHKPPQSCTMNQIR